MAGIHCNLFIYFFMFLLSPPTSTITIIFIIVRMRLYHSVTIFFYSHSLNFFASKTCTEMVMPIGHGANDSMFQAWPFDLNNHTKTCQDLFGVTPRPQWITTEFGGHVGFCFFLFYVLASSIFNNKIQELLMITSRI